LLTGVDNPGGEGWVRGPAGGVRQVLKEKEVDWHWISQVFSEDLEIKFRTVSTRTLDDTGAPSSANQLITKIYPQGAVHKRSNAGFLSIGIYPPGRRCTAVPPVFLRWPLTKNYDYAL